VVELSSRLVGAAAIGPSDKAHLAGQNDCGEPVTDAELGVDVLEVLVDRSG
jgi:hypothetical protein